MGKERQTCSQIIDNLKNSQFPFSVKTELIELVVTFIEERQWRFGKDF